MKSIACWRLPPVLVVQLKRFQYTQYARRKLHNLVIFPVNGLDMSQFLSRPPMAQPPPDLTAWQFLGGKLDHAASAAKLAESKAAEGAEHKAAEEASRSSAAVDPSKRIKVDPIKGAAAVRAETNFGGVPNMLSRDGVRRSVVASAGCRMDYEGSPLPSLLQSVYDLYGVVNHLGRLGGGHYTAYTKSPADSKYVTGRWRSAVIVTWYCFNDRYCDGMEEKDVVTPAAYLLFYVRRDIADAELSKIFPRTNHERVDISNIGKKSGPSCSIM
ncbi:Usp32 [Symbiodinium sp. KB8]|nr:Usp32 [Symbiodinium sp. KB8]